jgi:hypothetical protein
MDLIDLKGIGPKREELLNKLGIYTVSDLYNYYPTSFEDRTHRMIVSKANPDIKYYFEWEIISKPYQVRTKNGIITYLYAYEKDSKQKIKILWFNDRFSHQKLSISNTYKFYTKITKNRGVYESVNPTFCKKNENLIGNITAIYSLTAGINQKQLSGFIEKALENYDSKEEIFDKGLLSKFSQSSKYDNLKEVHFPTDKKNLIKAKSELKISDFVRELIYIDYIDKKIQGRQDLNLNYNLDSILAKLNFTLTRSQFISLNEILKDVSGEKIMNRLLIGDVGSGKTIIALIVMIVFGLNGYQSAMMVPTDVLANQQFKKNLSFIESFGLKAALLTGSVKDKNIIKNSLAVGDIDIVIGTHALIQENVSFKDLRFVVNDEQHRFGVRQRQALGAKAERVNYLTMTATPIPRTISLRLAQVLDLSIINELPRGRKAIVTKVIANNREEILFNEISFNLNTGRQIYVVSNNIDKDDDNSVENLYKRYNSRFKDKNIKKLHGKLNARDKEKILDDFNDGKVDILISTTVIEVGIDVANANTMVIYNANNFGLSTLHQLRGRVGRGPYESYCYLVSQNIEKDNKLNILVNNDNGFEIAKKDFELRGGGKILSSIQHGKNLDQVEYMSMTREEIEKSFDIFQFLKENNYKGVNFSYLEKFFTYDKRIILN